MIDYVKMDRVAEDIISGRDAKYTTYGIDEAVGLVYALSKRGYNAHLYNRKIGDPRNPSAIKYTVTFFHDGNLGG